MNFEITKSGSGHIMHTLYTDNQSLLWAVLLLRHTHTHTHNRQQEIDKYNRNPVETKLITLLQVVNRYVYKRNEHTLN